MATARVSGTEGYAEAAGWLLGGTVPFARLHAPVLHLFPPAPARVLDVGAGGGQDAAAFAALGHAVVAVEPVDDLRLPAAARHPSPAIEWLDDSLPHLRRLTARGETFDLVMLSAVWMHLDVEERRAAMGVVAALVRPGGRLVLSLRHGPVPAGRRMFEVSGQETRALAEQEGLETVLHLRTKSVQRANRLAGVAWTRLGFARPSLTSVNTFSSGEQHP